MHAYISVAQILKHGASKAKVMGFNSMHELINVECHKTLNA